MAKRIIGAIHVGDQVILHRKGSIITVLDEIVSYDFTRNIAVNIFDSESSTRRLTNSSIS